VPFLNCDVRFTPDSDHKQAGGIGSFVPKADMSDSLDHTISRGEDRYRDFETAFTGAAP
jgi:hypothetical protein